jgi:hypothetical protein
MFLKGKSAFVSLLHTVSAKTPSTEMDKGLETCGSWRIVKLPESFFLLYEI